MTTRIFNFSDGFTSQNIPEEEGYFAISDTQTLISNGTINLLDVPSEVVKVSGSGEPVDASSTPFSSAPNDGSVIVVMGTSSSNTVTILHSDEDGGCILNGDAILGEYDKLTLIYNETLDRYIEQTRNF